MLQITSNILNNIRDNHIRLEEFIVLYSKCFHPEWLSVYTSQPLAYTKLKRLEWLDSSNSVTPKGVETLHNILSVSSLELHNVEEAFEEWWKNYPSNDKFGMFPETRKLKTNKRRARELYLGILKEGIPKDVLLKAVNAEVAFRKKNSDSRNNQMKYMQSPAVWLYNRGFENWDPLDEDESAFNDELKLYGKDLN